MDSSKPKPSRGDVTIREIAVTDAAAAAKLSEELGYATPVDVMKQRIERLTGLADRMIFVACLAEEVVGWIDVGAAHHLQAEARAEIGGLVVAAEARSRGIGRCLVDRAERWALVAGLKTILVRSQVAREAAHRFYLREGYARTKTSAVFTKKLG